MGQPTTTRGLLNEIPGQDLLGRSRGSTDGLSNIRVESYQDLARFVLCILNTTILGAINTGGITTNGGTVDTTAIQINMTTFDCKLGGFFARHAALTNQAIFGAGAWAKTIKLDGTAAVMPSAEGKTLEAALVAVRLANGNADLWLVCGAEANDASQVAPTAAQIQAALAAAAISTRDPSVGLIVTRIKVARGATTTITLTHGAPSSTATLEAERRQGCVWPAYAADGLTMPEIAT